MDMAGNVTEWTNDWYATTSQYLAGPDPVGAPTVSSFGKIAKGANWDRAPLGCRLASRAYSSPVEQYYHYGFRICLIQDQEP